MKKWGMPPPIKVYEAIGAIGDGRVRAIDNSDPPRVWEVVSSDGAKKYRVEISADGREISSNDNASYWQGYLGYPAVAVLLISNFMVDFYDWNKTQTCATSGGRNCGVYRH